MKARSSRKGLDKADIAGDAGTFFARLALSVSCSLIDFLSFIVWPVMVARSDCRTSMAAAARESRRSRCRAHRLAARPALPQLGDMPRAEDLMQQEAGGKTMSAGGDAYPLRRGRPAPMKRAPLGLGERHGAMREVGDGSTDHTQAGRCRAPSIGNRSRCGHRGKSALAVEVREQLPPLASSLAGLPNPFLDHRASGESVRLSCAWRPGGGRAPGPSV